MRIPINVVAVIFGLFIYTTSTEKADPQDIETQRRALKLITETADSICNIVHTEGSSDSETVSGDVKAQVNGLIGKLVDAGIAGAGNYNADHYVGLFRKDLPKAITDNANCKLKVFEDLRGQLIPIPHPPNNTCPSIAGNWYSSKFNAIIPIRQDGCTISSEFTLKILYSELYYEMTGTAEGNKFEYTLNRTDPSGCTVIFYGRLTAIEQQQMISHTDRSSGQCGVAQTYTETMALVRR